MSGQDSEWTERLVAAARSGEWLDLTREDAGDVAAVNVWGAERTIPASAIRAAFLRKSLEPDPRGLRVVGANVVNALDLVGITLPCPLELCGSRFTHPIRMNNCTLPSLRLSASHVSGISLRGSRIAGNVDLDLKFKSEGEVCLVDARVGGRLILTRAMLRNDGGMALSLDNAVISGGASLHQGFVAIGEIRGVGLQVGGQLILGASRLFNSGGVALGLDGALVSGGLFLDGAEVVGAVRLVGATVRGQLSLKGATLSNIGQTALDLGQALIVGSLLADPLETPNGEQPFSVIGQFSGVGAKVEGQLNISAGQLANGDGPALVLDQANIRDSLLLPDLVSEGEVRLNGTQIGGQLILSCAQMSNPTGEALSLDGASVMGGAFLHGETPTNDNSSKLREDLRRFTARGGIRAVNSTVGGDLSLMCASLSNPGGAALTLDRAHVVGGLYMAAGFSATGQIDLESARLGMLIVDEEPSGQLSARGWKLDAVRGPIGENWRVGRAWLRSAPAGEFSMQAWHELAGAYERAGHPAMGKRLRFAAEAEVTRISSLPVKCLRLLYAGSAGYGYYPLVAGAWLVIAGALAGLLTYLFGPTSINPWLYGAAVTIPPAAAIIPPLWSVTEPLWLAWLLIFLKSVGWLLTVLLLAGVAGLLKKKE